MPILRNLTPDTFLDLMLGMRDLSTVVWGIDTAALDDNLTELDATAKLIAVYEAESWSEEEMRESLSEFDEGRAVLAQYRKGKAQRLMKGPF
jgi:hypothetical protein